MISSPEELTTMAQSIKDGSYPMYIDRDFTTQIYDRGQGEILLFTPFYENSHFIYSRQILELQQRYRVIYYTRRESVCEDLSFDILVSDLEKIVDKLGLSGIHAVSMCLTINVPLLLEYRRPGTFRSFFFTNCFVYMPFPQWKYSFYRAIFPYVPAFIAKPYFLSMHAASTEHSLIWPFLQQISDFQKKMKYGMLPLRKVDTRHLLASIKTPAYVLTSESDPMIDHDSTELVAVLMPNAQFETIGGIRCHFLSLVLPELFIQKLEHFIRSLN